MGQRWTELLPCYSLVGSTEKYHKMWTEDKEKTSICDFTVLSLPDFNKGAVILPDEKTQAQRR